MDLRYVLLAFSSIICCFYSIECQTSVTVETKSGSVEGTVINYDGHKINQFLGIPYAEPPVGSNRFGKPKPIANWNKTVDATHIKNMCWQSVIQNTTTNENEDCLFLNIWSENVTETKLRPVMFWIHGGGFHDGEGMHTNGKVLVPFGVVMVSINYRVGPFGFLFGNDSSAPGNVGIYDQNLALKWVHNNIEHFGGDPTQITIFGQSAGSWSVSAHIVSPLSRNLFKRAIMQSGAYFFQHYRSYNSTLQLNDAKKLSEKVGCNATDDKWLDCLRKVEPKKIIENNPIAPSLVFGNELLPYTIDEAVKTGKFQAGIEVMAGVTDSEGTLWAVSGSFGSQKLKNISVHITKDEMKTQIKSMYHWSGDEFVDKIYDFYISKVDESNQTLLRKAYIAIYTDTIIKCPTYYFTQKLSQFSAVNKVHFYELTYNMNRPEWQGVSHSDDLAFVFGNLGTKNDTVYEFSHLVKELWTNFAKSGNPLPSPAANTLGLNVTDWPTFRATEQSPVLPKVMELNPKNFGHLFTDPYHGNCDGVWKQYFGIE